mgnify:CR=1 FL=1
MVKLIQHIPTNVITGFLGVGKTTAILHLLKHKPATERWAVLVNEFGKIGIDGLILQQDGVSIKEIPGGCMCCAAGVSVQVGINTLLANARPDRLLIEPTGIGHPKQIIKQLSLPPFDKVLDMRACITLIDPRHLQESRYYENEYYKEQLEIADVLVANKIDQCDDTDRTAFERLLDYWLARVPDTERSLVRSCLDAVCGLEFLEHAAIRRMLEVYEHYYDQPGGYRIHAGGVSNLLRKHWLARPAADAPGRIVLVDSVRRAVREVMGARNASLLAMLQEAA